MKPGAKNHWFGQRGFATFSLLELVVVIILIAILFVVAVENLLPLRGRAEAAHVKQTLGVLRSAVQLRTMELVVHKGLNSIATLQHTNPVNLLAVAPANYRGAHAVVEPGMLPPGSWTFDTLTGRLLYRVRYPQYFTTQGLAVIRLQVQVGSSQTGGSNSVAVVPLNSYAWVESESPEIGRLLGID